MKLWKLLPALGLIVAAVGAYMIWGNLRTGPQPALPPGKPFLSATVLNDDSPLPRFAADRAGGEFSNDDLIGRWTFLFFGYTHCPDICPTTLTVLKDLKARAVAQRLPVPQVALISVDPSRDTPEQLKSYMAYFDSEFIGISVKDEALAPLTKHLGVMSVRHQKDDSQDYLVDHTAAIYLIDPQGRLLAVFSPPQQPEAMIRDYARLVQ